MRGAGVAVQRRSRLGRLKLCDLWLASNGNRHIEMLLDGRQLVFCELAYGAVMFGDLLPEVADIMPMIRDHVAHEFTIELVAAQSRKAILLSDRLRYRFFRQ